MKTANREGEGGPRGWKERDADVHGQKSISGQQGQAMSDSGLGSVPALSLCCRNLLQAAQLNHCHTAASPPCTTNTLSPSRMCCRKLCVPPANDSTELALIFIRPRRCTPSANQG